MATCEQGDVRYRREPRILLRTQYLASRQLLGISPVTRPPNPTGCGAESERRPHRLAGLQAGRLEDDPKRSVAHHPLRRVVDRLPAVSAAGGRLYDVAAGVGVAADHPALKHLQTRRCRRGRLTTLVVHRAIIAIRPRSVTPIRSTGKWQSERRASGGTSPTPCRPCLGDHCRASALASAAREKAQLRQCNTQQS